VLVALIATPLLYQKLGEDQFGLVSLSLTITMLLGIVVSYGFHVNGPKRIALLLDKPEAQSTLVTEVNFTRAILSLVVIGLVLIAVGLGAFPGYSQILTLSLIILLGEAVFPLFILQGLDRLSLLAISNAVMKIIYVVGILLVIQSPEDARWVNFVLGGSTFLVNTILLAYLYSQRSYRFYWVKFSRIKARLIDNFQFFSYTTGAYVLVNGGFILLSNFVSDMELGRFSIAQKVAILLRTVPALLTQSILQNASRLFHDDKDAFEKYLNRVFRNGLLITLAMGLGFAFTSTWVVRVLAGEFVPYSANILSILCFLPFLAMLNVGNMIRILVVERKQLLSKAMWTATFVMLVLGALGSHYYGGYGLAVALLISEAFNALIHWYLLKKEVAAQSTPKNSR